MAHLTDGTLRQMIDQPAGVASTARAHFDGCSRCRERLESFRADASRVYASFEAADIRPDVGRALARFHREEAAGGAPRRRLSGFWLQRKVWAGAAAVALVATSALTPAGGLAAQHFLTIFQPQRLKPVLVSESDIKSLSKLARYGSIRSLTHSAGGAVGSRAAAEQKSGMHILAPASLPSGVPSKVTYSVLPRTTTIFTFSGKKARALAHGKPLPSMPAAMNGSTIKLVTHSGDYAVYGSGGAESLPALIVGQMPAPRLSSTGVSVKTLENYMLKMPGISPQLASAIRAIGDPATTLPIPIPVNLASAQHVQVQGAAGLAVGDSTGIGSLVVWEKGGVIYGVGGTLPQSEVLSIAGSLR